MPSDNTTSFTIATFTAKYSGGLTFYCYGSGRTYQTYLYITENPEQVTYDDFNSSSKDKNGALAYWSFSSVTSYARTGNITVEKGKTYYVKVVTSEINKNPTFSSMNLKYDLFKRNSGVPTIIGIQRGTFNYESSTKTGIFPLNPVDVTKTLVLATISGYYNGYFSTTTYSLETNKLTLTGSGDKGFVVNWQVIEFI